MPKCGADAQGASRALIVHPKFLHTLADPPVAPLAPARTADWHCLPLEVVHQIAAHLERPQDLLNLSATCRDARHLAANDAMWKRLCCLRFGCPEELPEDDPAVTEPGFWLRLFQYNHRIFMGMVRRRSGGSGGGLGGPRFAGQSLIIQLA